MKYRSQIGRRSLISIFIFAITVCVVSCIFIGVLFKNTLEKVYKQQILDYVYTAAEMIDGDKVEHYLENPVADDYHDEIESYLKCVVNNSRLKYYYVLVPTDAGEDYIWDTDPEIENDGLGEHIDYGYDGEKEEIFGEFSTSPQKAVTIDRSGIYGYVATAYAPVFNSKGQPVALVGADLEMDAVQDAEIHVLIVMAVCILGVLAVFNFIYYVYIHKSIIQPIMLLNHATQDMVNHLEDDQAIHLDIHTHDEIENLGNSFTEMHQKVRQYIKRLAAVTAEKERIGAELNVASKIQLSMLPSTFPAFPDRTEFDIYASMTPAKEVGGDFYDYFLIDDDHLALVIADVSGKGVPAALFMVIAKTLLKDQAFFSHSPKEVLEAINSRLCENNSEDMFVTAWLCIYEISTGKCLAANAGHEYPMLRGRNGEFSVLHDSHGFVLAGLESSQYREYEFQIEKGGTLVVYTDGATEATNSSNELFGEDRVRSALNDNPDASPEELIAHLKHSIEVFDGDAPQFDDITILALKRSRL